MLNIKERLEHYLISRRSQKNENWPKIRFCLLLLPDLNTMEGSLGFERGALLQRRSGYFGQRLSNSLVLSFRIIGLFVFYAAVLMLNRRTVFRHASIKFLNLVKASFFPCQRPNRVHPYVAQIFITHV